ncbi:MAG: helix-turn-helix domain-containing protein, partial [Candidatus Methylacidiphilales bacterium]
MPRKVEHTTWIVERAKEALSRAHTVHALRVAQSILLPAEMGLTLAQTALMLGVSRATVTRFRAQFQESASPAQGRSNPKGGWGGRRHSWMTPEQEREFLAPWLEQAAAGHLVVVSPVWAA